MVKAAPAPSGSGAEISAGSVPARPQPAAVQQQQMARAKTSMIAASGQLIVRWTIADDGTLQRSFDNGQSWEALALSEGKPFRATASVGPVVWAGGSNGVLFRSVDAGEHWARIQPKSGEQSLTGDVTSIHLEGAANEIVRVQTSTGQKWISNDGGQRWRVE